uniref:Uncharacterized protein n=1 Tax=Cucumis melo TaxID=3656 RepID=A0A9I9E880_CUCME
MVQQAPCEWEIVMAATGFVEMRQRRSELRGQTQVEAEQSTRFRLR